MHIIIAFLRFSVCYFQCLYDDGGDIIAHIFLLLSGIMVWHFWKETVDKSIFDFKSLWQNWTDLVFLFHEFFKILDSFMLRSIWNSRFASIFLDIIFIILTISHRICYFNNNLYFICTIYFLTYNFIFKFRWGRCVWFSNKCSYGRYYKTWKSCFSSWNDRSD